MNIQILADAFCITCNITEEEVMLLASKQPSALKVFDQETKEQKFAIAYNPDKPSIGKYGVTFGGTTRDGNKKLTYTGTLPQGLNGDEAKNYVADLVAPVAVYLTPAFENAVHTAATQVKATRQSLIDSIEVR